MENKKKIITELPQNKEISLLSFAGAHKYLTFTGCALAGVSAVLVLAPFIYVWMVVHDIIEALPASADGQQLVYYGWMAVLFSLLSMAVYFAALMCTHLSAFRTARNMKTIAMHHLTKLPVGYFQSRGSGRIRRVIDDGASQTETYMAQQMPDLTRAFVTPVAVLVLLFVFDWRFGLISLLPMAIGIAFLFSMMGPGMSERLTQYQTALEDMNSEAVEYVRGIPVVKTFQQSVFSFKSFHDTILRYKEWVIKYTLSLRLPMCGYTVSINALFAFLIPAGFLLLRTITSSEAYTDCLLDLIFYLFFSPVCVGMMNKIMWTSQNTMLARDATNRILDILKEKPLSEPEKPQCPHNYDVEFDQVTFRYKKENKAAVDKVSFTIPQGSVTALVGASGGGKSTIASLIARFYDVSEGSIRIGGVDVKDMGTEELMEHISFVFQDNRLFKDSLLNNICAAKPNASIKEIQRAIDIAQCQDIIDKMPEKLDTVVGTKGVYLSGGETQRIALARAALKDAPIILLDEATAFADPDNEHKMQKAFEKLTKGKTVLMIAHRLSTVQNADQILVIEDGGIAEQGTHEELLEKAGIYAKMWKDYQMSIKWKVEKEAI